MNDSPVETLSPPRYDSVMETPAEPSPPLPSESSADGDAPAESSATAGRFSLASLRGSDRILGGCAAVLLASGLLLQAYGAVRGETPAETERSRLVAENGSRTRQPGSFQPGVSLVDDRGAPRQPAGASPHPLGALG